MIAAGVFAYYVLPIPWWGVSLRAAEIPIVSPVVGRIVQDAFGLGALALVWLLGPWLRDRTLRHDRAAWRPPDGSRVTNR